MIEIILSYGHSSILFNALRHELGMTYFNRAEFEAYEKGGVFLIHTGSEVENIIKVLTTIISELCKLKSNGISEETLNKAKKINLTMYLFKFNEPVSYISFYSYFELFYKMNPLQNNLINKLDSIDKIINYINNLNINDINNVIKNLFKLSNMNVFIYGNLDYNSYKNKIKKFISFSKCLS